MRLALTKNVSLYMGDKTLRVNFSFSLQVHLERRGLPLADDVAVEGVAGATTGFTGADLANLVNEAALLAGRRSKVQVGREEFDQAILRAVAGIEKKRSMLQVRGPRGHSSLLYVSAPACCRCLRFVFWHGVHQVQLKGCNKLFLLVACHHLDATDIEQDSRLIKLWCHNQ